MPRHRALRDCFSALDATLAVASKPQAKHVPLNVFSELRFLKPLRQIDAAQSMISMNRYSLAYAKSLVASSAADKLVEGKQRRQRGLTEDQIATMQRESENIDREFKLIEQGYGADHLDLVIAKGYVGRLLEAVMDLEAGLIHPLLDEHLPQAVSV